MSGHESRRASTSIGALTRRDHYREAMLRKKIDETYRSISSTPSARQRRKKLRAAHRHERALVAHRRRPQSALTALALLLALGAVAVLLLGASTTPALIFGVLLVVDLQVIRRRKRRLRFS